MSFNFRENTASGRKQEAMDVSKATGAKNVGKVLGAGEPGNVHGFRPGGHMQTGYNTVGGKSGLQVKIPGYRDQSKVK
jgi:hypothetical protein